MNTFTDTFGAEVLRAARKELKPELQDIRKALGIHRSEMTALQRELNALAAQITQVNLPQPPAKTPHAAPAADLGAPAGALRQTRFQAQALANKRAALGLTQKEMGRLIGASSLSVYRWESGHKQPRDGAQLQRIAQVLKMGKREALDALADPDGVFAEPAAGTDVRQAPAPKASSRAVAKTARKAASAAPPGKDRQTGFDARALISKREALGLTRQDMARLLDASLKSVYRWESGRMQPRAAAQLARIAQVLKMDKRQALDALTRI